MKSILSNVKITIRQEQVDDFRRVEELTREAFWDVYIPGCNEHFVIHNLRTSPDFIPQLSLVAEIDGQIVGHIAYCQSYILHDDGSRTSSLVFGPLSTLPQFQKQGVGGELIRASLAKARELGHSIVCILGDPRYYRRFGFRCAECFGLRISDGRFAAAMMALELQPGALADKSGRVFDSEAYAVEQEAAFEAFDATFPERAKGHKPSQDFFAMMMTMIYE